MREIKFRAWSKGMKRMFENVTVYPNQEVKSAEIFGAYSIKLPEYSSVFDIEKSVINDFEIMQFTGLHDKNGKEIWEGDILWSGMRRGDDKGWTKEVVWSVDGEWCLLDRKTAEPMQMQRDAQLREVLGNIYKNPELLKDSQ